jgi:DNA/RNA-binding domain of Phe-tRNA-synthetase-like protein
MEPLLTWSKEAAKRFPGLFVCAGTIVGVKVERCVKEAETLKQTVLARMRRNYKAELLKYDPVVRAYRDLYWSLCIDPTKTRLAGEALLRRVLHGNDIPSISNVVDAYNLASLETIIPLSGFDLDRVSPPLEIRFSNERDEFIGIGMNKSMKFLRKALLVSDTKQILCVYPYRDADITKINAETRSVLIIGYGALNIGRNQLVDAAEKALTYIKSTAGGLSERVNVFHTS